MFKQSQSYREIEEPTEPKVSKRLSIQHIRNIFQLTIFNPCYAHVRFPNDFAYIING